MKTCLYYKIVVFIFFSSIGFYNIFIPLWCYVRDVDRGFLCFIFGVSWMVLTEKRLFSAAVKDKVCAEILELSIKKKVNEPKMKLIEGNL